MILIGGRREEAIHATDRGLAYGDGVFRTMLARAGTIRYWSRHYRKLAEDCRSLGIACPTEAVLVADVREILRVETECVVKIIVTRGVGGRGYFPAPDAEPTRIVASFPAPVPRPDRMEVGVRVRWCTTRLSVQPALAGVKHLNRLENVLARGEWSDPHIAEGLMRDNAGNVIEATASNVFLLEGGHFVTPDLSGCGVSGVQRDRVMSMLPALGLHCAVEPITPERVLAADQVVLVNSVIGLWWVSGLDARTWQRSAVVTEIARRLEQGDD